MHDSIIFPSVPRTCLLRAHDIATRPSIASHLCIPETSLHSVADEALTRARAGSEPLPHVRGAHLPIEALSELDEATHNSRTPRKPLNRSASPAR